VKLINFIIFNPFLFILGAITEASVQEEKGPKQEDKKILSVE
jgi:hypothetical protein